MNRAILFGLFGLSLAGCTVARSLVEEYREPPASKPVSHCDAIPLCSSPPLRDLTPGAHATFPQDGPDEYPCAVDPSLCRAGDTKNLREDDASAKGMVFVVPAGEALVLRGVRLSDARIILQDAASLEINEDAFLYGVVITTENPTDSARMRVHDADLAQVRIDAPRSHLHVLRGTLAMTTLNVQDLFVQNSDARSLAASAPFFQTSGCSFRDTVLDGEDVALSATSLENSQVASCAALTMISGRTQTTKIAACSREPARFFYSRLTATDLLGSVETLSATLYFVRFFGDGEQDSTFWRGIVTHSAFCTNTRGLFAEDQSVSCIACDGNESYAAESCTATPPRERVGPCKPFESLPQCEGEFQPPPQTWLPSI